ncbi:hypothetical protein SGL43_01892 [Streptomyces globisporus]|uniref:Uncharacterized protein n=1 Tax=Streptomyces globisporus TaxID=1908 RepID=A0ABM9GTT2_STRGL|nr:hypothetical protein SGL43_01892 [Streptomyces globisporus]
MILSRPYAEREGVAPAFTVGCAARFVGHAITRLRPRIPGAGRPHT